MTAIHKKGKARVARHWRLHLLSVCWGAAVAGVLIAAWARRGHSDLQGEAAETCTVRMPRSTPDQAVRCTGFTVHFNRVTHLPNYVVYRLTRDQVATTGKSTYSGTFFAPDSVDGCALPQEYAKSGYQRGHMAPAADMRWNADALRSSYSMLNVCPQRGELNTGAWQRLEEKVREWADRDSVLVVAAGPILARRAPTIGSTQKIAVPDRFFKVVFAPYARPQRAIAFVMPNGDAAEQCSHYAVSVDEVERLTGFDFFSTLPKEEQARLESGVDADSWFQF